MFGWTAADASGEHAQDLLGISAESMAVRSTQLSAHRILHHRDGTHLRLSLRHTPFLTGRNVRSVAHECMGSVSVDL